MTIGLAGAIENVIRHHFQKVFQNDSAIITTITLPKFKLKWVEYQSKRIYISKCLFKRCDHMLQIMNSLLTIGPNITEKRQQKG